MADSSVASAPKKGFFNQYAPLWPSTVGLACAYMGLVVATQGSLRFTDQGVFTDGAAAVALILEVTAELVIGVPGLGRTLGIAQSSGAVTLTYALVVAIGIIGIIINLFARYIERRVLRWHPSVRRDVAA